MILKLASINHWGLAWPFSIHKKNRLSNLVELIKKRKFDIVCLQEVWKTSELNTLRLSFPGYFFFYSIKKRKNPSGLVILSKYQLYDEYFIPFGVLNYEAIFEKGLLLAKISIGGKEIRVINTHLQASFKPLKSIAWQKQLEKVYSAFNDNPTLIFGDFNYNYPDFHLPDLNLISQSSNFTRDTNHLYNKKSFNSMSKVNMVCDLIFSNFKTKVITNGIIKKPLVSDHYPIFSEIEI